MEISKSQAEFLVNEAILKINEIIAITKNKTQRLLSEKYKKNELANKREENRNGKSEIGKLKKFWKTIPENWYRNFIDFIGKIPKTLKFGGVLETLVIEEKKKNKKVCYYSKSWINSYSELEEKLKSLDIKILFTGIFNLLLSKIKEEEKINFINTYADKYLCQLDAETIKNLLNDKLISEIPRLVIEKEIAIEGNFVIEFTKKYPKIETPEVLNIYLVMCLDLAHLNKLSENFPNLKNKQTEVIIEIMKDNFWKTKE